MSTTIDQKVVEMRFDNRQFEQNVSQTMSSIDKLNNSLQSMGLEKAFDESLADLSGMGTMKDGTNIFIDLVFQKAVVIVDEEGTEAAAVTAVLVANESCAIEEPPVNIFFDEPFLYLIVDLEKEIPLFMGIMDNPAEE